MKNKKGFSLIEVLVSLTIISIVGVGFLSALTTSSRATITTDQADTSRTLVQSQMEYVKELPFATSYSPDASILAEYPGYSVAITAVPATQRDSLIQKITVTVSINGETINTLEGYKAKR